MSYTQIVCPDCGAQVGGDDEAEVKAIASYHAIKHAPPPPKAIAKPQKK